MSGTRAPSGDGSRQDPFKHLARAEEILLAKCAVGDTVTECVLAEALCEVRKAKLAILDKLGLGRQDFRLTKDDYLNVGSGEWVRGGGDDAVFVLKVESKTKEHYVLATVFFDPGTACWNVVGVLDGSTIFCTEYEELRIAKHEAESALRRAWHVRVENAARR